MSLIIFSQSNSGSTWLTSCLRPEYHNRLFPKEYFNSVLNHKVQRFTYGVVGNEIDWKELCYRATQDEVDEMIRCTWNDQQTYNVTKENYLAFRMHQFCRHFSHAIMLRRDIKWCFPPERARVKTWYNAWYQSMIYNKRIPFQVEEPRTHQEKAVFAWQVVAWKMEQQASDLQIPTIDYDDLMHVTKEEFDTKWYSKFLDGDKVISTRKLPPSVSYDHCIEWERATEYLRWMQRFKQLLLDRTYD